MAHGTKIEKPYRVTSLIEMQDVLEIQTNVFCARLQDS